jgi:hypothetical protein
MFKCSYCMSNHQTYENQTFHILYYFSVVSEPMKAPKTNFFSDKDFDAQRTDWLHNSTECP